MKTYTIPVQWSVSALMNIEADDIKQALVKAYDSPLPTLPNNGEYLDHSFEVLADELEYWNTE